MNAKISPAVARLVAFPIDYDVEPVYAPIWKRLRDFSSRLDLRPIFVPIYWNNQLAGYEEEEQSYQLAVDMWAMALLCHWSQAPPLLQITRIEEDEQGNQVAYPFSNGPVNAAAITGQGANASFGLTQASPLFLPEPVFFRAGSTLLSSVQNVSANAADLQVVWFGGTEE